MNPVRFAAGLVVTILLLAVLHQLTLPKRVHVTVNYAIGVASIFIGIMVWRTDLWMAWAFPVAGGATVVFCYMVDTILNWRIKAKVGEKHIKAILNESERSDISKSPRG